MLCHLNLELDTNDAVSSHLKCDGEHIRQMGFQILTDKLGKRKLPLGSSGAKCCILLHNSRVNKLVLSGISAELAHLRQKSSNPRYNRGRGTGNCAER